MCPRRPVAHIHFPFRSEIVNLNVLIIGAVATGPKAGCRIKRLMAQAKVTMLDRDQLISYGGCGIPYYISGDVSELETLMSTSFHMVRDARFFQGAKGVEVLTGVEATAIDRAAKKVAVRDVGGGGERELSYDKLVIATGSRPFIPPVPGMELERVLPVANLHQAETIQNLVAKGQVGTAAVIGAGATGLEMAEALSDLWGVETHVFEMADHVLPGLLDAESAAMLQSHLAAQEDLHLHMGQTLEAIIDDGKGGAAGVRAGGKEYPADLVIVATGVRPNSELAAAAGLEVGQSGGILVNQSMQTSDEDIYAGGDCTATRSLITGQEVYMASGSLANRQGRVIGSNICGGDAKFPGAVGSFCIKLFGLSAARTGIDADQAKKLGLEVVAPLVVQSDRAHFHPDVQLMYVKLCVERGTKRVLGCTILGESGDAVVGRVNALAGLIAQGADLSQVSNLEMCYSPPLGAALDIINAAANTCENLLDSTLRSMSLKEFTKRLEAGNGDTIFLDMRAIDNAAPYLEALSPRWVHLPQETLTQHLDEVPRDKDLVLVCNSGARSYEGQVMLDAAGIENTFNLSGGVAGVKKSGTPIIPEAKKE